MIDYKKLPPECNDFCRWRWCFQPGEDKGTYVAGRGYTSYHTTPRHVCMNRLLHGCPDGPADGRPLPDMDKLLSYLAPVVSDAKASKKVKVEMRRMLDLIRLLDDLIKEMNTQ